MFHELKSSVEFLFDSKGNLIPYSDKLWVQICDNLDGKMLPHNLYNSLSQNRHNWKSDLKKLVSRPPIENDNSYKSVSEESSNNEFTDDEDDAS